MDNASKHLLVVDDDPDFLHLIAASLRAVGYQVSTAASGTAARNAIREQAFDLVLLDAVMPHESGFEVLRSIRATHSPLDLPIIMVTGLSDSDSTVEALILGANDYIIKPFDPRIALARIQTHLTVHVLARQNEEFFSIASHDIKKPLALIIDAIETLRETPEPPPDYQETLAMLHSAASTMHNVVHDFLNLQVIEHRRSKAHVSPVDISRILHQTVTDNGHYAAQKNIALQLSVEPDLPMGMGESGRLLQIADNLVGNAIKFSPGGTMVKINCHTTPDGLCFEVCDQGPGFTPENLCRVFEKYANLGNTPTGNEVSTGLGLAICKQLVELLDGEISVHNNEGAGATFRVHLQRAPARTQRGSRDSAA